MEEKCVIFKGDSFLVIQFINRLCTPRVNSLVERVVSCQEIKKKLNISIHVVHIPREMNQLADWLSRCGTSFGKDITLD